jgi:hypothetical protein
MKILVFILSVFVFIKTLSYGIFEIKEQKNKSGRNMCNNHFHSCINIT